MDGRSLTCTAMVLAYVPVASDSRTDTTFTSLTLSTHLYSQYLRDISQDACEASV